MRTVRVEPPVARPRSVRTAPRRAAVRIVRRRVLAIGCAAVFTILAVAPAAGAQTSPPGDSPPPSPTDLITAVLDLLCKLTGLPLLCPAPTPPNPGLPAPSVPATPAPGPDAVAPPATPANTLAPSRPNPLPPGAAPAPAPSTSAPAAPPEAPAGGPSVSAPAPVPSRDAAPGATSAAAGPPRPPAARGLVLPRPQDLDLTPTAVAGATAIGLLGLVVIGFPAELFNKTLQHNYGRLARVFPWVVPRPSGERRLGAQFAALLFSCTIAGVIGMFQKLHDWNLAAGARTALGIACGFLVTVLVFEVAGAVAGSRMGLARRSFRSYPGALPMVALFVGVSTFGHLQPAYVYGHLAGSRWDEQNAPPLRGRALQTAVACLALLVVALGCWGARAFVTAPVGADVLAGITLVGLNRLAFGLIPVTFLDGHAVFSYSRALWASLYSAVMIVFILLVLLPTARRRPGNVLGVSLVLFVLFAGLSVALWAWFRRSHQRQLTISEALS